MSVEVVVQGMDCEGCVASVERVLRRVPGVRDVKVDLASGRVDIDGEPDLAAVAVAVKKAGYAVKGS